MTNIKMMGSMPISAFPSPGAAWAMTSGRVSVNIRGSCDFLGLTLYCSEKDLNTVKGRNWDQITMVRCRWSVGAAGSVLGEGCAPGLEAAFSDGLAHLRHDLQIEMQ